MDFIIEVVVTDRFTVYANIRGEFEGIYVI